MGISHACGTQVQAWLPGIAGLPINPIILLDPRQWLWTQGGGYVPQTVGWILALESTFVFVESNQVFYICSPAYQPNK